MIWSVERTKGTHKGEGIAISPTTIEATSLSPFRGWQFVLANGSESHCRRFANSSRRPPTQCFRETLLFG
ncbi:MAG: hypothetical protein LBI18_11670 [Planctomycetaceae bacterium]|nr:hypothetical protein [Planctomycetaceae bacterium]